MTTTNIGLTATELDNLIKLLQAQQAAQRQVIAAPESAAPESAAPESATPTPATSTTPTSATVPITAPPVSVIPASAPAPAQTSVFAPTQQDLENLLNMLRPQPQESVVTTTLDNANKLLNMSVGVAEGLASGIFGIARVAANLVTLRKTQ